MNVQYIGETEKPLYIRMNGHRSHYILGHRLPDKPVAELFNAPGHTFDDLTVMIIEKMCSAEQRIGYILAFSAHLYDLPKPKYELLTAPVAV